MLGGGSPGFSAEAYLRAKSVWKGRPMRRRRLKAQEGEGVTRPFSKGRDPRALGDVLEHISQDMGWRGELDQARLVSEWPDFAGESTAAHTTVTGIENGVLLIQCDSTTWATELRRLRSELVTRILIDYPDSEIRDIKFMAPGAPTWRHGRRVVPGRGPRDTYG